MPADGTAPIKTIGAHPRQHHGKHAGTVNFDRGVEEHIHGGAAVVLKGTTGEMDRGRHASVQGGEDFHMPVAAGDEYFPGMNGGAIASLAHSKVAATIKTLGEKAGKQLGHVLHDQNRERKVPGKCR
jgi:hypothetical protein